MKYIDYSEHFDHPWSTFLTDKNNKYRLAIMFEIYVAFMINTITQYCKNWKIVDVILKLGK